MGNKSDKYYIEATSEEKEKEYAEEIDALYARTSAKGGFGIEDLMIKLCKKCIDKDNFRVQRARTFSHINFVQGQKKKSKKIKKCCQQ